MENLTPQLIAEIIAFLGLAGGLVKALTDLAKVKAARLETAARRDQDSQELHDTVLQHGFAITQLKDSQSLQATAIDDLRDICNALNTNIVKLDVNVGNLAEAIKELKK